MKNVNYINFIFILLFNLLISQELNDFELYKDRIVFNKNPREAISDYEWTIIGAGPAGVIAVCILLDLGIPANTICWIDPLFNVGRIGEFYTQVVGNTSNLFWIKTLQASTIIEQITKDDINYINTLDPNGFSNLDIIVKPFQKVTDYIKNIVNVHVGYTESLEFFNSIWHIGVNKKLYSSKNVILATGCSPIQLNYTENSFAEVIPLDYALNPDILKCIIKSNDSVALFGSSHSAILILKYLSEQRIKNIYNFYRSPLLYAIDMGNWILNSTNGLKGETAKWAREVLEKNPPANLIRLENTEKNRKEFLSQCTKIIYAIGYRPSVLPPIITDGVIMEEISFDPESGIIGPRLFGMGIAFPGQYYDLYGNKEQLIGVHSFIRYALSMIPDWMEMKKIDYKSMIQLLDRLKFLEDIINISIL